MTGPRQPDDVTLARWLNAEDQRFASEQQRLARLFDLLDTHAFAQLWYAARDAGEMLRARALQALYTQRTTPGGPHPDPRQPAAFSSQAILSTAARLLGASIWQAPEYVAAQTERLNLTQGKPQLAWLTTYPNGRPPDIAVRVTTRHRQQEHDVACLLGYLCREHARLNDPDSPAGMVILPVDPGLVTILHQFAIGLLGLPVECPEDWRCRCNGIRRRYNAPPPDHQQATDSFNVSDVRAEISRQTRKLAEDDDRLNHATRELMERVARGEDASDPHRTNPNPNGSDINSGPLPPISISPRL